MLLTRSVFLLSLLAGLEFAGSQPGAEDDLPLDDLPAALPGPPAGLAELADRAGSTTTVGDDRAALGRRLFFDPILSVDRTVSCASCHRPDAGFADPRPLSEGVRGQTTTRHAPTLFNRALGASFMWDGSAATLEEQVLMPVENPIEMDLPLDEALARLAADEDYAKEFGACFGRPPDADGLADALAAFVRRLWSAETPFDRFRGGDVSALSAAEKAGFWLYESRGGCWRCHGGANFTDEGFHNTGVGVRAGEPREGRAAVTGAPADRGRFKTPTLRGLAFTAPYMHDGSLGDLRQVVEYYRRGGNPNSNLSPHLTPLELTDRDVDHLVAFLEALSRADSTPAPNDQ